MRRWVGYGVLGLAAILALFAVAAFLLIGRFDFASLAASRASAAIGRSVTVAGLHVTPGRWLRIELQGVHVANLPNGTRPEMAGLESLTVEIEAWSLVRGPIVARRLDIDGLSLLLERVPGGAPNWRRDGAAAPPHQPEDRTGVPTLLQVHIGRSEIIDHTSSGKDLPIRFDDATLQTAAADAPVRLQAAGAFRGVPLDVAAELQPIAVLRDAAKPYGMDIRFSSGSTTLRFAGTMTKPLDFDGTEGALTLQAAGLGPLLAIAGAESGVKTSLDLAGTLTRSDTLWVLRDAAGRLGESRFTGSTLRLTDGGRGHPDDVSFDLRFDALMLDPLLKGEGGSGKTSFAVEPAPDPLLHAKLSARKLAYDGNEAADVRVSAAVTPGQITVDELALTAFGARLQASGHADAADKGTRLSAEASIANMSVEQLGRQIGAAALPIQGALDALLSAEAAGATLDAAIKSAHVSAVVWMPSGRISRDVLEKASTDIRRLFRRPAGMAAVSCLVGIIDMKAGVGTVSPLRIRTADGAIAGRGSFDLNRRQLDFTVGSQGATTSDFALDVPFRISGTFDSPSVRPASGSPALVAADSAKLPPALSQAARRNPCLSAR